MNRKAIQVVAVLAALGALARPALAYRPFDGTDADVAAEGEFELELGPAHYLSTPGGNYLFAPDGVLNLGFARGFEAVIDFKNVVGLRDLPGQARVRLLDVDVFVKGVLRRGVLQDATGVSLAPEAGPLLPGLGGQDGFGAQANLITSYRWTALALHLNTSAALSRAHNFDGFVSLIAEGPHDWPVRPVAELYVEREVNVDTTYSALIGAIWQISEGFAVDGAARVASESGGNTFEARLGFTWAIRLWGSEEPPRTVDSARPTFPGQRLR